MYSITATVYTFKIRMRQFLTILIEPAHDKTYKMACVPSEDSDQPVHPPSLIRVFAVRSVGSWGLKLSSCRQRKLWSDWADTQADLSLRWAHMPFCRFCHARLRSFFFYQVNSVVCDMSKHAKRSVRQFCILLFLLTGIHWLTKQTFQDYLLSYMHMFN